MKIFKRIIRRKGVFKFFVFLVLTMAALVPAFFAASQEGLIPDCTITNYKQFVACSKTNRNVVFKLPLETEIKGVKHPTFYDLDYSFMPPNKMGQLFFEVNVGGYSVIMLVNEDVAKEINTSQAETIEVRGRLVKFEGSEKEAYNMIRSSIIERLMAAGYSEEEAKTVFPLWQVKGYFETNYLALSIAIIFTLIAVASLIISLTGLKNFFFPNLYKLDHKRRINSFYGIEKIASQYKAKEFDFTSAQVFVTEDAVIINEIFTIFAIQNKNLVWFYEDTVQKLFSTNHCVVLYTKDGKKETVELDKDECPKLLEVLREKNENAIVGYSKDLEARWKKDYKSVVERII